MKKKRIKIPFPLESEVLYLSAKTCAVCRTPGAPVQIHHIDNDPSNNSTNNLIVLCQNCHDEAHTKRALSKNLSPKLLVEFKKNWEAEVEERSSHSMTTGGNLSQASWAFVNHQRLLAVMKANNVAFDPDQLSFLESRGVVDKQGIPIFPNKAVTDRGLVTIYDRFAWDDSLRLHSLYTKAVDQLIVETHPIELGAIWTKREIKAKLKPGSICFCMRGFLFKRGQPSQGEEDRRVYARSRNIEVRLFANTRHMFGSSALYSSFCGSRFAAVLFMVKDIASEEGVLVIRGTPLAMGAGFIQSAYCTPHPLRYGWARHGGQTNEMLRGESPPSLLDW